MDEKFASKIVQSAAQLFMKLGIRSVTMDDIARDLGVSKKTLYQYFSNKDTLVTSIAHEHIDREKRDFEEITASASNAIEEIHGIARCMRKNVGEMNASTLYDLQKFHREAWNTFLTFKNQFIAGYVESNLKKGIDEGYYRSEINSKVLAKLRVEQVELMFDEKIFPASEFNFADVQNQMLDHFIHGLLTDKGRALYHKFQKEEVK